MYFSNITAQHRSWDELLVIGRTIEVQNEKYHMLGMTAFAGEVKLYIIEPFCEPNAPKRGGIRTQRRIEKEEREVVVRYLDCSEISIGEEILQIQGGTSSPLQYAERDYGVLQLFLDMMSAGWTVPEYLQETPWENLQLVELEVRDGAKLPYYTPKLPIKVCHRPQFIRHFLEKTVTLRVGKSRSLSFVDDSGEEVQIYIEAVTLIDVWKDTKKQFENPKYAERFSEKELQQIKENFFEVLAQSCPQGMYYIGIEYACSKDINLQFYSKEFLKSVPETHSGSASAILMHCKPEQEIGVHNLPLKGCMIQTPVSADTVKIGAELFFYTEKIKAWEEVL